MLLEQSKTKRIRVSGGSGFFFSGIWENREALPVRRKRTRKKAVPVFRSFTMILFPYLHNINRSIKLRIKLKKTVFPGCLVTEILLSREKVIFL
jgi:hypothetical protein